MKKAATILFAASLKAIAGWSQESDHEHNAVWDFTSPKGSTTVEFTASNGELSVKGNGAMEDFVLSNHPFKDYRGYIKSIVIDEGITHIGNNSFNNCAQVQFVVLPSSLISIGRNAFRDNQSLLLIDFTPCKSLATIGSAAFKGCNQLKMLNL